MIKPILSVGVIIQNCAGQAFLVEHYKHQGRFGIIAGNVEEDDLRYEDPFKQAMQRELREELGIQVPYHRLNFYKARVHQYTDGYYYEHIFMCLTKYNELRPCDPNLGRTMFVNIPHDWCTYITKYALRILT